MLVLTDDSFHCQLRDWDGHKKLILGLTSVMMMRDSPHVSLTMGSSKNCVARSRARTLDCMPVDRVMHRAREVLPFATVLLASCQPSRKERP